MSQHTINSKEQIEQITLKIITSYRHLSEEEMDWIALLQDIQDQFRYLPPDGLKLCARELNVPLSQLYSIATFYTCFSLAPRGKTEIQVCMGTACHIRGAEPILDKILQQLALNPGETSPDLEYSLETVNCVGACARGPLVIINSNYYGNLTMGQVENLLSKTRDINGEGKNG